MARERNASAGRRMDLNLYIGPPRLPYRRTRDLGSDLALGFLPQLRPPTLSAALPGDSRTTVNMTSNEQQLDSHPPYSPSHAEYLSDLTSVLHTDSVARTQEYTPFSPSLFEPFGLSAAFSHSQPAMAEIEGHYNPYTLSNIPALSAIQELDETAIVEVGSQVPYNHATPPVFSGEPMGYLPTYVSRQMTTQDNRGTFGFHPTVADQAGESLGLDDQSSFRHISPNPTFIQETEASNRLLRVRLRSSLSHAAEMVNADSLSSLNPESMSSFQRPLNSHGKHKVAAEHNIADASETEGEEKSRNTANFECNICLDVANEPVVTSCGHLFCWPCLYKWLHVHSDHKECPVCKGEVTESNITPIYGRGTSQFIDEMTCRVDEEYGLKIPPRPRGNRLESLRQQLRPISRTFGQGFSAWRHIYDRHFRSGRHEEAISRELQEALESDRRLLSRLRNRRFLREANPEIAPVGVEHESHGSYMINQRDSTNARSIFEDGTNIWQRLSLYNLGAEGLVTLTADFGRVVEQLTSNNDVRVASTPSVDLQNQEPLASGPNVGVALAAEQASASSTMAVIQGDFVHADAVGEPSTGGSSRPDAQRGRGSSSSLDIDGGTFHISRRRRLI